jgi:hypothetical protein
VSESLGAGVSVGEEEEARRYSASSGIQRGGASRGRARTSVATASTDVTDALTDSDAGTGVATVQERAQTLADTLAAKWKAKAGNAPPLAHAHPPTLAEAHARLLADVKHVNVTPLKWARFAYGYLHLLEKLVLHAIEYCTRSPWGLLGMAAAVYIVIHWI